MRIRRAAVLFTLALVAACASEDNLNPQPLPPEDQEGSRSPTPGGASSDGSLSNCSGTCCSKPAVGSPCVSGDDTTCSWAVTCPGGGLVVAYQLTCVNGAWQLSNGCPDQGQTDDRGCPASQPENGSACTVPQNTFPQCGYVLECTGYRKSAVASCFNNGSSNGSGTTWNTTPLGTCD